MSAILSDIERKARKQHRCYWCPNPITVGTTYRSTTIVDGGDIQTSKEHIDCGHRVWAYARDAGIVDEYDYGYIEWSAVLDWEQSAATT